MPYDATAPLQITGGLTAGDLPKLSLIDQAIAGFFVRIKNPRYAKDCWHNLQLYRSWCADQGVDPMTARKVHLEMYLRWLQEQGWAESTVQNRFATIGVFYHRALLDELISKDPAVGIERPTVDKAKQHRTWLKPLEMARVIEAARTAGPHPYALVLLMGQCGLRVAEACSLRIETMTQEDGYDVINFIGKGGGAYAVALPIAVMRAVQVAIGDRTEGPLLLNQWGRPMTRNTAWRTVKRLAADAGVDPQQVACHTFRRTAGNTAAALGMPVHKVQQMLRHKDPRTTTECYLQAGRFDDQASHLVAGFYATLAG